MPSKSRGIKADNAVWGLSTDHCYPTQANRRLEWAPGEGVDGDSVLLLYGAAASNPSNRKWMAICLALVAGYVDGYGLRVLNNYVSFMSGNTTFAGLEAGQGKLAAALPPSLAIAGFLAGSFAGSLLSHSEYRYARRVLFPASAGLLALVIVLNFHGSLNANLGLVTLSLAMGLLNPAVSRIGRSPESDLCDRHSEQDWRPSSIGGAARASGGRRGSGGYASAPGVAGGLCLGGVSGWSGARGIGGFLAGEACACSGLRRFDWCCCGQSRRLNFSSENPSVCRVGGGPIYPTGLFISARGR